MGQNENDVYRAVRQQLVSELAGLTVEQAALMVPSCPAWSVKDVVAHVAGLVADIRDEVPPPLGSDENTSRQVNERATMSLPEICEEWMTNDDGMAALENHPDRLHQGLLADLTGHVYDLAEMDALADLVTAPPSEALSISATLYVGLLQARAAEHADIALTVELGDQTFKPNAGTHSLSLQSNPLDLVRSVSGRRTRACAEQLAWSSEPTVLLDSGFLQYGPFRNSLD